MKKTAADQTHTTTPYLTRQSEHNRHSHQLAKKKITDKTKKNMEQDKIHLIKFINHKNKFQIKENTTKIKNNNAYICSSKSLSPS